MNTRAALMACMAALAAAGVLDAPGALAAPYRSYRVTIAQPAKDSTVFSNPGDVDVQVSVSPALEGGDKVELWLDKAAVQPPASDTEFHLKGVLRGKHTLRARVIDASNDVIGSSGPATFYVWHASRLYPNRQGKK